MSTTTNPDSTEHSPKQSEKQLDRLRDKLGDAEFINDPDLTERVRQWERRSF